MTRRNGATTVSLAGLVQNPEHQLELIIKCSIPILKHGLATAILL